MSATNLKVIEGTGEIVDMAQRLLERAKAGELTCLAFCAITIEGGVVSGWSRPPYGETVRLIGGVNFLTYRINANLDEGPSV